MASARLPAVFEFLVVIRGLAEEGVDLLTTAERMKRALIYRACVFMYNFGLRFCNVAYDGRSKENHAIRRCDVVFHDVSDRRFGVSQYFAFLVGLGLWGEKSKIIARVKYLVFFLHSSKVGKKVGRIEVLARRGEHEVQFLEDMASWILWDSGLSCDDSGSAVEPGGYDPDALIFARAYLHSYHKGLKWISAKLTRKQISEALKFAAERLGLDSKRFASHCLKIGAVSEMTAGGEDVDVIRRLGDHSENSASTFIYQHTVGRESRPLLIASSDKGLSVRDIALICPIREVSYEELAIQQIGEYTELAEIEDDPLFDPLSDFAEFEQALAGFPSETECNSGDKEGEEEE